MTVIYPMYMSGSVILYIWVQWYVLYLKWGFQPFLSSEWRHGMGVQHWLQNIIECWKPSHYKTLHASVILIHLLSILGFFCPWNHLWLWADHSQKQISGVDLPSTSQLARPPTRITIQGLRLAVKHGLYFSKILTVTHSLLVREFF